MNTNTSKALEELRFDLVRFIPEESLDVIVQFSKLRDKEDSLGEVLTFRM